MSKIAILKTGSTLPELKHLGDFENWIAAAAGLNDGEYVILDGTTNNENEPNRYNFGTDFLCVFITGSHDMVTDGGHRVECLKKWIRELSSINIPIFGICFGHQLLCETFGGKVGYNQKGLEVGIIKVNFTEASKNDSFFKNTSTNHCYATHYQSVLQPPEGSVILAENDVDFCHAYKYKNCYGTQFHPEFTAEIAKAYLDQQKQDAINAGFDLQEIYDCMEVYDGRQHDVLKAFVQSARQCRQHLEIE